jgi:hypothetical protein
MASIFSRHTRLTAAAGALFLIQACPNAGARPATWACHGAQQRKLVAEIIFGRNIGDAPAVDDAAWEHFVDREMTPRFPDGLTITDATGQWREPKGGAVKREAAKHVEIAMSGRADDQKRLAALVEAYKEQFHQRGVVVIIRPACVSF